MISAPAPCAAGGRGRRPRPERCANGASDSEARARARREDGQRRRVESTRAPVREHLRGRSRGGEDGRDQDVRVENRPHSAQTPPRRVLCLDGGRVCLLRRQVVALPEPGEKVEPELAPECLLDDLAVAPARARPMNLHGPEHRLVDRQRRANLQGVSPNAIRSARGRQQSSNSDDDQHDGSRRGDDRRRHRHPQSVLVHVGEATGAGAQSEGVDRKDERAGVPVGWADPRRRDPR